jgi:alginate O-acetyltransferase complex protein AlgI
MVFSSPIFLFLFLPITLGVYFLLPWRARNLWLLGTSLVFYGWGEPKFVLVMLASIIINFLLALWIDRARGRGGGRLPLTAAVVANIGLLGIFKYTDFVTENLNVLLAGFQVPPMPLSGIALPIGISFFTFQALSYVIDVYRREAPVQRNPLSIGLYIALYPQLIAGPIVRYHDVARQIEERSIDRAGFAYGVERFVVGLGKKVLIANSLAVPADLIFSIPGDQLTLPVAWLGLACYTLQIYFDFSGYSDMAIGLGRMLGFRFLENFNYPYISQSLTEFWRRWHISLSTWFRDYLYIPLGGNRVATSRIYVNLIIIFFLVGLWHGASWNFVFWGFFHGAFLVAERVGLARWMDAWRAPFRHLYALLVVMVSWVFFRAASLSDAWRFLGAMVGLSPASGAEYPLALYADTQTLLTLAVGVVAATPVLTTVKRWRDGLSLRGSGVGASMIEGSAQAFILIASVMLLAAGTYNPFIYFRF